MNEQFYFATHESVCDQAILAISSKWTQRTYETATPSPRNRRQRNVAYRQSQQTTTNFGDSLPNQNLQLLNGQQVKVAKLKGEFIWHQHEHEDELFLVMKGRLRIKLPDREVTINAGEFFIVPKGVEHLPIAEDEVHVILLEPVSTLNTGNVRNERTVERLERV